MTITPCPPGDRRSSPSDETIILSCTRCRFISTRLLEALMKADEDQAEALDKAHAEMAERALEVDQVIAAGGS